MNMNMNVNMNMNMNVNMNMKQYTPRLRTNVWVAMTYGLCPFHIPHPVCQYVELHCTALRINVIL